MTRYLLLGAAIVGATAGCPASPAAQLEQTECPGDAKLANLIAASEIVLIGKMDVPLQRLMDGARKPSPDYLDIPIQVESVVKGAGMVSATVRFYPQDAAYKPSNSNIITLADKPAILFLTRVDEGPVGLYFAGNTPDALMPATETTTAATRIETARQARITASWRADTALPRFAEVRALISRLGRVSGDEQQRVFNQLEALGEEGVPAIIAQMDDRRPLRTQAISLVNHAPDAFEGMRHYGPEQVVDGLDAVLNQITGENFGSIVNGGSDREREAAIAGWRVYATDLRCPGSR